MAQEYASGRIAVGADARMIVEAILFPPLSAISWPFAWANRLRDAGAAAAGRAGAVPLRLE